LSFGFKYDAGQRAGAAGVSVFQPLWNEFESTQ